MEKSLKREDERLFDGHFILAAIFALKSKLIQYIMHEYAESSFYNSLGSSLTPLGVNVHLFIHPRREHTLPAL
jgi:hypothetical protein